MFSVVQPFAYGRRGRRHAVVLSTHASAEEAFRVLDELIADPPPGTSPEALAGCYVVDDDQNPVVRTPRRSDQPGPGGERS